MAIDLEKFILEATGSKSAEPVQTVQSLWSGYGKLIRYKLSGAEQTSIIVKHINPPPKPGHPRGFGGDLSHKRKLRSYQVETLFYKKFAEKCSQSCRVPTLIASKEEKVERAIILEDLDRAGFSQRLKPRNLEQAGGCISWLADFHAVFLNTRPDGLWPVGTYWHLGTRPEELQQLKDKPLKEAASRIDAKLNSAKFQTLLHGDAKVANFCFADFSRVAAVDFQYTGAGCGMKDLAYLVGSCFDEVFCAKHEKEILGLYFQNLKQGIYSRNIDIDFDLLENEWRALYHVAWADFHRFLKGWSPGHWKINDYSERVCQEVIRSLHDFN